MAENTSATGGYLIPDGYLRTDAGGATVDAYTKTETDALLAKKANNAELAKYATLLELENAESKKADVNNVYTKAATDSMLLLKADLSAVYTRTQADERHADLVNNFYSKSETQTLLSAKVDVSTLEANYTKNTDLNKALNDKVGSADLAAAVKTRQDEQAALQKSVLETAADLQGQITTMQGKLTDASDSMQTSLTAMQSSLTTTADSINARYDELVANVTKVSGELSAKDATLQGEIDAVEALIPTAAAANNQLADKAYVEDLVKKGAARAISADAAGAGFASLDALTAGPWYSLGEATTPAINDYAVVKKDATHSGNDVRYNYDGAVWVFFQEFSSGGGQLDLTTAQNNALNSGITAALVAKISANENAAATESAARSAADTELLAKISTETGTRETVVNNLTAGIAAEKLARENADNQLTAKVESEAAARGTAINEVKAQISTAQSAIETQIGTLATLNTHTKTSVVEAVNDLHTELHNERLAVDGSNQMNGELKIILQGSGELLQMQAGDKGVNFHLDATTGVMGILPASAPTTGFAVTYNALKPRTSAVAYSLGDSALPFTNLYTTNINGTAVSNFAHADAVYTKSEVESKIQNVTQGILTKSAAVDLFYPVGSVYLSMDANFNPATAWGGTWEKIKDGVFLESNATPNTEKEAGLPNITGTITSHINTYTNVETGAIRPSNGYSYECAPKSGATYNQYAVLSFDASRSSAVYGKSDTVQPASITVIMWKRTA